MTAIKIKSVYECLLFLIIIHNNHLNIRVLWTCGAPLPGTAFLFPVFIKLWVSENSHTCTLVLKSYSSAAIKLLLGLGANRQNDGNRQVDCAI